MLLLVCIVLALLSFMATGRYIQFAESRGILIDHPNHRSSHSKPVVRGAGIIFVGFSVICWGLAAFMSGSMQLGALCIGAVPLAIVSFWDDVDSSPVVTRLVVHVLVSAIFLCTIPVPSILEVHFGIFSCIWYPAALFFMVAVINLYNFMDGIDGLISLQGVAVLAVWCLVSFWTGGHSLEYLVCAIAAATIFGFLLHNWRPSTVFMGDVGSTFIGYTIGCLAMVQTPGILRSDNFFVLIILMLPVLFDATFTLLVRMIKGEKWYRPHKCHLFQRLILSGYTHAQVSSAYGAMTVFLGLLVLGVRYSILSSPALTAPFFVSPFLFLYLWVRRAEKRSERE
jgi:UDP-N-acetylmuramyl pentapeptide phosphotransferase/UDP-N-acetylglucosamine-1-phosphate transferase